MNQQEGFVYFLKGLPPGFLWHYDPTRDGWVCRYGDNPEAQRIWFSADLRNADRLEAIAHEVEAWCASILALAEAEDVLDGGPVDG